MERPCPIYLKSILSLKPTLSIIGNVSSSTGILILHGQNDSGSRVQQAFLLQQRLIELNRPDHTLITYPDLGHHFYPSSQWTTESGPIPEYVLADLYAWLALIPDLQVLLLPRHLYYRPGSCSFKGRPNPGLASKIFNEIQRL